MITGPRKRAELSKPSSSKPAGIVKPKPLRPFQRPTILDTTDEDIPDMDLNAPSVNIGPPATSAGRPSTARRFKQRESSATTFTFIGERATGVDVPELYASSEDITRRLGSRSRTRRLSPLRQSSPASSQRPVNPLARTRTSIFQPKEAKVEYALLLSADSLVSTHACKSWTWKHLGKYGAETFRWSWSSDMSKLERYAIVRDYRLGVEDEFVRIDFERKEMMEKALGSLEGLSWAVQGLKLEVFEEGGACGLVHMLGSFKM